jgi:CAAX prenyl protease-like protein
MPVAARNASYAALALFFTWAVATWFLEGRIHTFLRPGAMIDRLVYVVVANLLIGTVGAFLVLRFAISSGGANRADTGVGPRSPSILWIIIGILLGLVFFFVQGAPTGSPIVIINAYAQVFAVSVAEVMVCWALVGGVLKDAFGGSRWVATVGAAVLASVLFGIYHFGHSPPFNSVGTVVFLAAIGLVTSAFFFASRDVYATIAFHNFLGVYGVVQALAAANQLDHFMTPQLPLILTALIALLLLIGCDVFLIRRIQAPDIRPVV